MYFKPTTILPNLPSDLSVTKDSMIPGSKHTTELSFSILEPSNVSFIDEDGREQVEQGEDRTSYNDGDVHYRMSFV